MWSRTRNKRCVKRKAGDSQWQKVLSSFASSSPPVISGDSFSLFRLFQRRVLIAFIDCRDEGNKVLLVIPCHSTSPSLYLVPPFSYARSITRSASYHWTTASLFHRPPLFFSFLAAYPSALGRGSLSHVEVHSSRSCNVVSCATCRKAPLGKLASPTHFSSTLDESLRGLFNGLNRQSR